MGTLESIHYVNGSDGFIPRFLKQGVKVKHVNDHPGVCGAVRLSLFSRSVVERVPPSRGAVESLW